MTTPEGLYLDLMKRVVSGVIAEDPRTPSPAHPGAVYDAELRARGGDWPSRAHTMIGLKRLDNIQFCTETALADGIRGDFAETGVWRGGACIFMRAVLKAHGVTDRSVWVADSFRGFPPDPARASDRQLAATVNGSELQIGVTLEEVQHNFSLYGLLDSQVRFLPGFFADTLPSAPVTELAVLRLDGDLYSSTMDALTHLYPKVPAGGFVIIDDYDLHMCREAVDEYRREHEVYEPLHDVDSAAVWWRRET